MNTLSPQIVYEIMSKIEDDHAPWDESSHKQMWDSFKDVMVTLIMVEKCGYGKEEK